MSTTPRRSRTPTRVPSYPGTPDLGRSPSRLATPPAIRSVASVSSFRVYSHGSSSTHTPGSVAPTAMEGGGSSSSPSGAEGIMIVQEPDADVDLVDGDEGSAAGIVESRAGNEESKKILREQLRRTLSKKESFQDIGEMKRRASEASTHAQEVPYTPVPAERYTTRQYFVLTDAGKPVFVSDRDANSDGVTSMLGVVQALISIFLDDNDKLRSINSRDLHIVFLLRPPLYYVCVSSWGEPESVARFHLEYLHLQILSIVSAEQLRRMFEQRRNFDLRRLLGGAEPFLYSLLARLEWDLAMSTSSLHCLKLDPVLRKSVADILVPKSKIKDILYVIVIAQGRVITLVRPRKHSIHPSDLHILINTIHSPSILNNSAAASWLPVCLPKFNASAFVNAYVMFLPREDAPEAPVKSSSTSLDDAGSTRGSTQGSTQEVAPDGAPVTAQEGPAPADTADVATSPRVPTVAIAPSSVPDVAVVAVSGSADFDAVRSWCDTVSRRLNDDGLSRMLARAIAQGDTEYSVSNLGVPGLRHFVYKSRSHVQLTMPTFEEPYDDLNEKRRLVTLYQTVYDAIHAKSGQERTLKLQYVRTSQECVMGWITQPFELYLALSPRLPKSAAVGAANAIARWVQKEEKQLFLKDAPVF